MTTPPQPYLEEWDRRIVALHEELDAIKKAAWAVVNHHHTDEHLQVIVDLKAALTKVRP